MKKSKILLIIITCMACIFLTGCNANYEIEIYNDVVKEDASIIYSESIINGLSPYEYTENKSIELFESTDILASRTWKEKNNSIYTKNTYSFNQYTGELVGIATCYELYKVNKDNKVITVLTSNVFNCFDIYPELESVTLKIKSNHKMVSNNADKVDRYNYYWYINKDNYTNKPISLKLSSDKYIFNYENEILKKVVYIGLIVGIIVGVSGITYLYFKNKNNRLNEI